MENVIYKWTDAHNDDFRRFYLITEQYYNSLVGGSGNRKGFVPYNLSDSISDVLIAYINGSAVGCAGLKKYSAADAEIKRVWVEPQWRGNHIASVMMDMAEEKAFRQGFDRTILQTRKIMTAAVSLYENRGYHLISNYPPYDKLEGAVCYAKEL